MSSGTSSKGKRSRSMALSPSISTPEEEKVQIEVVNSSDEKSLEILLEDHGYLWNRAIYIGEGDNAVLMFVKASILGHKVYIEIDDYNKIRPNAKDLSVTQMMRLKKEVVNKPQYLEECSTYEVSGTAYECSGGFCTLRRDYDTLEVVEEDFYIKTERQDAIGFEKDPSQGKPIVKLSEIRENNGLVIANIVKASRKLAMKAEKEFHLRIAKVNVLLEDIRTTYSSLLDKVDEVSIKLTKDVYLANQSASDLMIPPEEHEKNDYIKQTMHLQDVHSKKRRFYKDMAYLDNLEDEFTRLANEIDYMKNKLNEEYL